MKKILLSIFAVLFAFAGVQAQETATLSFADKAQRTSFSTEQQVWEQNGITFTNNKASSTTNVADYAGPVRLYAKSEVIVEHANTMTQIVFTCGSSSYATTLKNSIGDAATASGSDVTVALNSTTFTVALTAQVRVNSITVTYTAGGGEGGDTPALPTAEKPVFNPESQEFNLGESVTVEISAAEGATIYYTTDGETPTEDSDVYENALTITETTTVKAIAVIEGHNNSAVAEATYTAVDPNAKTAEVVAQDLGYANAANVEEIKIGSYITVKFENGTSSNATKYYSTGYGIRNYNGNVITFTAAAGVTINSIVFTAAGTSYIENPTNLSSGTATIDGTVTTISNIAASTLSFTQSSNTSRIQKIEVSYSVEEGVVVIATPSIAGEETFVGSTTVEITNNAAGTTLYYSTNGEDYVAYTGALNISETTTVYAKAVDAQGNESAAAEATFTKLETLTIAEAKAAYDAAGANVDIAMDLTGAVVTVNSGLYMFIENETTGINIYNSGADYAVGTKFTSGYILGTSTTFRNMHQITGATFHGVATTEVTVEPLEVTIADIAGNYEEYEGRFVKLEGVSIASDLTMTQDGNDYKAYDRFELGFGAIANCDVTGVVAIYNTGEQLYVSEISRNLNVTAAEHATLYLDYSAVIPEGVEAYIVKQSGINEGYITMTQIEGTIPANAGVIIKAQAGDYELVYSTENVADVTGNLLAGSVAEENLEEEAYVLGIVDGVVGLYKAQMTDGVWLNNANKAYLPASALTPAQQTAAFYGFDWNGTTGIENVVTENGAKAIFDLTGRRVEAISAPGIYIVNGKKVLVK